ncbi:MAG: glycosyltransferase, partial [Actinomycetota bacterium]
VAGRFDAVIVKSEQMAQVIDPVPAHVVPNGVDLEAFSPADRGAARRRLGWPDDRYHVLFPGNPRNARKNHPLARQAVEVAQRLVDRPIDLQTLWEVPAADVPLYMNGCDAMLMASYLEGSPNVVKEAMACDLPVIAVPVGDVVRLLDGVPGYTVCGRDANSMGAALARTLGDGTRPQGREAIERLGLDLASVAHRLTDIYRQVLA